MITAIPPAEDVLGGSTAVPVLPESGKDAEPRDRITAARGDELVIVDLRVGGPQEVRAVHGGSLSRHAVSRNLLTAPFTWRSLDPVSSSHRPPVAGQLLPDGEAIGNLSDLKSKGSAAPRLRNAEGQETGKLLILKDAQ